ncbi:MAG: methionyl-tRNA formyltransferase [Clostridia bacterium]
MRIVYMGTPQFAVPCLEALIDSTYEVVGLVCQPDKKQGRTMQVKSPPTKEIAIKHQIPVLQPTTAKDPFFIAQLLSLKPDLLVTCAYGKILPLAVLNIPPLGCINVHASLLPALRGAAPIQWAIIRGMKQTGITTMLTDIGMDTGPMLLHDTIAIDDNMTAGELHDLLMFRGPKVLLDTLARIQDHQLNPIAQNEADATYAPMLKKEDGNIVWNQSSTEIFNLIRGTSPRPGAYSKIHGRILKIFHAQIAKELEQKEPLSAGTITAVSKEGILVSCGNGNLLITEVQPESGKRMDAYSFANGNKISIGDVYEY